MCAQYARYACVSSFGGSEHTRKRRKSRQLLVVITAVRTAALPIGL